MITVSIISVFVVRCEYGSATKQHFIHPAPISTNLPKIIQKVKPVFVY